MKNESLSQANNAPGVVKNRNEFQINPRKEKRTQWGVSILFGFLLSVLAAIPKLLNLVEISEKVNSGQISALAIRAWNNDFFSHIVINFLVWTLIIALILWIWKKINK